MSERDDAVSYEHDYRTVHGPVVHLVARSDQPFFPWFYGGFCPRCCCRLSCNRTLCFPDEDENQCSECRVIWHDDDEPWPYDVSAAGAKEE